MTTNEGQTPPGKQWEVIHAIANYVQVVPAVDSDEVQHELSENCVCGPRLERVSSLDGSDGWIVIHASLDGREQNEEQNEEQL